MKTPEYPSNEKRRVAALRELGILDTEGEDAFDAIVELAAHIADAPIALVSLVDADRQWFKARLGLAATETSRDVSFCAHAIADDADLVVQDATEDERFRDNPLVVGEPSIRFYAGRRLFLNEHALGTLCVIDRKARVLTDRQLELLDLLAVQVERLLELRLERQTAESSRELIRSLYAVASSVDDVEERIARVLEIGSERFGARLAIVSEITDDLYTVQHVDDRGLGVEVGTTFALGETFCSIVLAQDKPVRIANVGQSKYGRHPAYEMTQLEAYIGARVFVNGEPYGTLNFSSPDAREFSFTDHDVEALQLMAAWVGAELSRAQFLAEREQLIGDLQAQIDRLTQLEELIAICSWCKKVRDDEGSWKGLERYVEVYSGARFSHGICPSCRDEHFGE